MTRRGGGGTKSPLRLGARRQKAFEMFVEGASNVEVARALQISPDTAGRYKKLYDEKINEQAASNPHLLREVLPNTIRSLQELDKVRAYAWSRANETQSDTIRAQMLNVILKAQDQRAKLFGLMGVKQEALAYTMQVQKQQEALIEYMRRELCVADRAKLDDFIVSTFADDLAALPTAGE
jgi:hypothetical protein